MKDKKEDKDAPEGPVLKTAGADGEITAGFLFTLFNMIYMCVYI